MREDCIISLAGTFRFGGITPYVRNVYEIKSGDISKLKPNEYQKAMPNHHVEGLINM